MDRGICLVVYRGCGEQMMDSRDFLFEFRETRDRVTFKRRLLTGLQVLGSVLATVGWMWLITR